MGSKFWIIFNWIFLVFVTLFAVWVVWGFPQGVEDDSIGVVHHEDCVDVSKNEGFGYEACYDANSESIFFKVSRADENYKIEKIMIYFVDLVSQTYDLDNVPLAGEEKAYKLSAAKNPGNMDVRLEVGGDFIGSSCGGVSVFVDYCPSNVNGEGVAASISPIKGVGIKDFIDVKDFPDFDSDVVVMDLADKEKIWESKCKSNWDCGEWEICEDDVQRRDCKDLNNCVIPTDSPTSVQGCDGTCVEKWECEWSACVDGESVPDCNDLNDCGTFYSLPEKLSCAERGKCVPDVVCSDWSVCEVDYDFLDLLWEIDVTEIEGARSRTCVDKEGCISTKKEEQVCSVSVDIYTERFEKCGESYVGVYDVLDDSTLAVLKEGSRDNFYLDIYFDDKDGIHCDFCFDGVMNGDETGVDCGGSCKKCGIEAFVERSWWDFLF